MMASVMMMKMVKMILLMITLPLQLIPATNMADDDITAADAEIEEMQKKVAEMEEEAEKLKKLTDSVDETGDGVDREEVDKRSVYVGQVDWGATPEELQEHFKTCGQINRITILVDKFTGHPKGRAYIEFGDEQSVQNSLLLNGSLFRGRQLKVIQKRTNIPGFNKGKGKGKAKGKGKGKGPYYGYAPWRKGYKGKGKGYAPY
ncbi:Polyadenylate-binding protein 2 [Symbiodinium microadriaticum]|uniref:Polyadenylate-binding protein 2 n=1 Tax=Symbiodinium microadriaticum TaxID=2951 RepID=A0A1Q9E815_SYMMI|nr:Polyadenylate-binding protein 2 [Symbiodinium microadriaticum]